LPLAELRSSGVDHFWWTLVTVTIHWETTRVFWTLRRAFVIRNDNNQNCPLLTHLRLTDWQELSKILSSKSRNGFRPIGYQGL